MCARTNHDRPEDEGIGGAVRDGLVEGAKESVRWAVTGAIVGAIVLGGVGAWFFGMTGLGIGAVAGAILGGIGAWIFYLQI